VFEFFKAALVTALLLMSACTVGPRYEPPQPAPSATAPFVSHAQEIDSVDSLQDDWWRLYRSPALDELIAHAFASNTDLRVAMANLERARAVVREVANARWPATTVTGGATYGDGSQGNTAQIASQTTNDAQWSQNAGLSVSWEVDLFGRVRRTVEAARADAEAVQAARDAVRVTVAAETTRAYINACAYAFAIAVARDSLNTSNENLRLVTEQERAGTAGKLDLERAGAASASARAAIPPLENQRRRALFELAALLGATPAEVPEAANACAKPPEPVATVPVGDGAALLRRRPDLRQAERRLAADTARIGVATADLYPRISLGGSGNYFHNAFVAGSDSFSFALGPAVTWSFPNIGAARARLWQARAQGEASLAAFDGTVITALKEVEEALTTVSSEQARLDALTEAQARAEKAHVFVDLRYRAGSASYLDVLVAQHDLLEARAAYADSVQQLASARVDLFKALGGGWSDQRR
jgi:NodT family efflux transporter outer membrane factor (OMF) lipoprotein